MSRPSITIPYYQNVSCSCSIHPLFFLFNVSLYDIKEAWLSTPRPHGDPVQGHRPLLTWSATTNLHSERQAKSFFSNPSLSCVPIILAESGCSKWQTSSFGLCISKSGNVDQRTVLLGILELFHSMVLTRNFCDSHLLPLYRSSPREPLLSQNVNISTFVSREASRYQPAVLTRVPVHNYCPVYSGPKPHFDMASLSPSGWNCAHASDTTI